MYPLKITADYSLSLQDLIRLHKEGHGVYRSSHAGNWNMYKLILSQLGIPDCIWDVTCMNKDRNNQPEYRIMGGTKEKLIQRPVAVGGLKYKYLTAYQRVGSQSLAQYHVAPLLQMYGSNVITTQSRALLQFPDYLKRIFDIVATYMPQQFGRCVLPCGCMTELKYDKNCYKAKCAHRSLVVPRAGLAESAFATLQELESLVFNSEGYEPHGGALYSFELVVAAYYLWSYWKFGDKLIYELAGPDMLKYATKQTFIAGVAKVLKLLSECAPDLVPGRIEAKIVPVTGFRFAYPTRNYDAQRVMNAHDLIKRLQKIKRVHYLETYESRRGINVAITEALGTIDALPLWDLFHNPATDAFYSQHDLFASGDSLTIMAEFMDVPLGEVSEILKIQKQRIEQLGRHLLVR